jgi:hypothetical protein
LIGAIVEKTEACLWPNGIAKIVNMKIHQDK